MVGEAPMARSVEKVPAPADPAPAPQEEPKPASPTSHLRQWLALMAVMAALFVTYSIARDVLYRRFLYGFAQDTLNGFATGTVEKIGSIELTPEGNILLRDAVVTHNRRGAKRIFYRAERIEIALDGWPMRGKPVHVMRVDLFHPEMWIVRETDGDWNIVWAVQPSETADARPAPPPSSTPPSPPPQAPDHPPRGGWPRNGVHVHHGIIHTTFLCQDGSESRWDITDVNMVITRAAPGLRFGPFKGRFYGGTMTGEAHVTSYSPFRMNLQATVHGADAGRLAAGRTFKRPIQGRVDGVLALKSDTEKIGWRPVCAGRVDISDGDLWDLPPFVGVLATLALSEAGDRKLRAAQIEFSVERTHVRIDKMNFLGRPLNLFGEGTMALTGENLDVVLVPRFGKSMDDVLPLVGIPIQWLLDIFKGAFLTIRATGAFWAPVFSVNGEPVSEPVKKAILEHEK